MLDYNVELCGDDAVVIQIACKLDEVLPTLDLIRRDIEKVGCPACKSLRFEIVTVGDVSMKTCSNCNCNYNYGCLKEKDKK